MGEPVEETLDEFLDKLGKKPIMQDDWDKTGGQEIITNLTAPIVSDTVREISKNFRVDTVPEPIGAVMGGTKVTDNQQKTNIGVIAYALVVQDYKVTAEEIWKAWPTEGDAYKLSRAGKRPSINAIQSYLGTDEFKIDMANRGVEFDENPGGLSDEQIALLNILSDTSSKLNLGARLRKGGVKPAVFKAWKRQRAFSEALNRLTQIEREDAADMVDLQLISMAQSGDLNAIKYYNDLVGRGPNDKKAVDAVQFAQIVLEAVQKNITDPNIIKAISADIEFASKRLGA